MEYQQESEEREKTTLTENQRGPEDHDTDFIH